MATRRMLHNKISLSEQVNKLSDTAALLYTWMIPHADDDGRLKGEASYIRAKVFPMKDDIRTDDVEQMLQQIEQQGLIWRWSDEYGSYIEFPTWKNHQTLQNDRYKASKIPSYQDYVYKLETARFQNDSTSETQGNKTEDNQTLSKDNEIENEERGSSRGEPPDVSKFIPASWKERILKQAWNDFDKENPSVFESRYLRLAKVSIPITDLTVTINKIKSDPSIVNKGEEFEKRITERYGK